jgi:hypothetical protein
MVARIVSGGQTGVDRGALDAALGLGIPCGGWCPRGRRLRRSGAPTRGRRSEPFGRPGFVLQSGSGLVTSLSSTCPLAFERSRTGHPSPGRKIPPGQ